MCDRSDEKWSTHSRAATTRNILRAILVVGGEAESRVVCLLCLLRRGHILFRRFFETRTKGFVDLGARNSPQTAAGAPCFQPIL